MTGVAATMRKRRQDARASAQDFATHRSATTRAGLHQHNAVTEARGERQFAAPPPPRAPAASTAKCLKSDSWCAGSRPAAGSSASSTAGPRASARATSTRAACRPTSPVRRARADAPHPWPRARRRRPRVRLALACALWSVRQAPERHDGARGERPSRPCAPAAGRPARARNCAGPTAPAAAHRAKRCPRTHRAGHRARAAGWSCPPRSGR